MVGTCEEAVGSLSFVLGLPLKGMYREKSKWWRGQETGSVRSADHYSCSHLPKNYILKGTLDLFCCLCGSFVVSIAVLHFTHISQVNVLL